MFSLLVFLVIFGVLIFVHEFGHFLVAKILHVKVERFSLGFGPALWRKQKGQTEYTINAIPLGGYVKLSGDNLQEYTGKKDEYFSKTPLERAGIIFCGPALNYLLGIVCFVFVFFIGYPSLTTRVGGLLDGYGAKAAGIQVGDLILAVDGKTVHSWEELQMVIYNHDPATPLAKVLLLRQNQELQVNVNLQKSELPDELGQKRKVSLLGISPKFDELMKVRYGLGKSFLAGCKKTWEVTVLTCRALIRISGGKLSLRDSITGPLGIFYITSQAAHAGLAALLQLVAMLSVGLTIFNLLPLPVLDGGHLFLLLIEKIRGRRLSAKLDDLLSRVGLTLILFLVLVVTYNDFLRFKDKILRFLIK